MTGPAPGPTEWVTFVLICGSAVLSGLLELLFVPLYIGSVVIPVAVVAAVAGNIVLPVWGARVLNSTKAAVVPVALWLLTVLVLSLVPRPEGDLFVLGAHGEQWNFYGLLLLGSGAGFASMIKVSLPPTSRPAPPPRPTPSGRSTGAGKNRPVSR